MQDLCNRCGENKAVADWEVCFSCFDKWVDEWADSDEHHN